MPKKTKLQKYLKKEGSPSLAKLDRELDKILDLPPDFGKTEGTVTTFLSFSTPCYECRHAQGHAPTCTSHQAELYRIVCDLENKAYTTYFGTKHHSVLISLVTRIKELL